MNIKLTLSWNGEKFSGYQYQPDAITVQGTLNSAWKILTQEDVVLYGCSRLDAKVHASHYVLNFHSKTELKEEKIIRALNGILHNQLKADISIYHCEFVDDDFHARFNAVGKHYRYLIWNGHKSHALLTPQCWVLHFKNKLTLGANEHRSRDNNKLVNLEQICQQFIGEHDFAGFRASDCSAKHTIKTIYSVQVHQHPHFPEMTFIDFFGDGFLKNMIRNMVGTAVQTAIGKLKDDCIQNAFQHKNRELVGQCAPGSALTLMRVYYNKEEFIADATLSTGKLL